MSFLSTPSHALRIKDVIEETRSKGLLQDQECTEVQCWVGWGRGGEALGEWGEPAPSREPKGETGFQLPKRI